MLLYRQCNGRALATFITPALSACGLPLDSAFMGHFVTVPGERGWSDERVNGYLPSNTGDCTCWPGWLRH